MLKIVIDTNVLIDSDHGDFAFATRILDAVLAGEVEAFVSNRVEHEARLKVPHLITDVAQQAKIVDYFKMATRIENPPRLGRLTADPDDDKFIELAVAAHADYIVSSDHHLLEVESFEGTRIVAPDEFWQVMEDLRDPEGQNRWQSWFHGIAKDE